MCIYIHMYNASDWILHAFCTRQRHSTVWYENNKIVCRIPFIFY